MRRKAVLTRGVKRHPLVSRGDRISHLLQVRDGDAMAGFIDAAHSGMPTNFAGDLFPIYSTVNVKKNTGLKGSGYATEFRGFSGPALNITASDVVIENIRFVYGGSLTSSSLIARPVRCSGDTYSPDALSTATSAAAIVITGSNVTVRNCWFDGFDNAIYSTGANTQVKCCYFQGGTGSTKSGVYFAGTHGRVAGCHMESLAYGVYVAGDKSSVSDNTILSTESGVFVTSDYNRIHGNYVEGNSAGFAMALTHDAQSNSVTGNVALPPGDGSKGTYFFTTGKGNMYGANIGEVDLE